MGGIGWKKAGLSVLLLVVIITGAFVAWRWRTLQVDWLVHKLASKDAAVSDKAAAELAKMKDAKAVSRFIYHLGDEESDATARVRQILAHMGAPAPEMAIAELRRLAQKTLRRMGTSSPLRGGLEWLVPGMAQREFMLATGLMSVLNNMGASVVDGLIEMTKSDNKYERQYALPAMKWIDDPRLFDVYLGEITGSKPPHPAAAEGLAFLRGQYFWRLRYPELMKGKEEAWKRYAEKSKEAVDPLLDTMRAGLRLGGYTAMYALKYYTDDPTVTDELLPLVEDRNLDLYIRSQAMDALRFGRERRVLDAALARFVDKTDPVDETARGVLTGLPNDAKVKALIERFDSADRRTRARIVDLLMNMAWEDPFADAATEKKQAEAIVAEAREAVDKLEKEGKLAGLEEVEESDESR